jgi:nitroimidazol reductase NimA-like FMN-containing flavoprotein (pyridoxamine 5'-phosphate oxidase superfamily)
MSQVTLRELSRTDCLALLRTTNLGSVALTRRALPAVVSARYLVHDDRVLVHMSTGLDRVPWIDGEVVALHVSAFDDDSRYGWSVSVTGAAHGTPNPTADETRPHAPWIPRGGGDLIAISTDLIWGERLGPTEETTPPR